MEVSEKGRQPRHGLAVSLFVRCFSDDWRELRIEGQRGGTPPASGSAPTLSYERKRMGRYARG